MYVSPNFRTKKALKIAVTAFVKGYCRTCGVSKTDHAAATHDFITPGDVTVFSPGPFPCPTNGSLAVEGPHYPSPHTWYATVVVKDSQVISVK